MKKPTEKLPNDTRELTKRMKSSGCPNCHKEGPHFVPPSFGAPGFYLCQSDEEISEVFAKHKEERDTQQEILGKNLTDFYYDECIEELPKTEEVQQKAPEGPAGFYF